MRGGERPIRFTMEELELIARKTMSGDHGPFLTHFCEAFDHADDDNKVILMPAYYLLIQKYDLARKAGYYDV